MSTEVDNEVLEEGEIEDEEEESPTAQNIPTENGGRGKNESGRISPKPYTDRRRRHSYGKSTPPRVNLWESISGQRPHEPMLPPLTRGGYWAPPPVGPLPTPTSSSLEQSPGSRVFKYLRNRTKSAENDGKEMENRQPVSDRSVKRKAKLLPKHDTWSQSTEEESDFENLLRKHKEIQAQLAKLSKEEEKSETDSSVVDSVGQEPQVCHLNLLSDTSQVAQGTEDATCSVVSVDTERADVGVVIVNQDLEPGTADTQTTETFLDDDDLQALELRKLALESVVSANAKKSLEVSSSEIPVQHPSVNDVAQTSKEASISSKRRISKGETKPNSPTKRSTSSGRSSHGKGHSQTNRERKLFSPHDNVDRYGRQKRLRRTLSSQRELERRRREAEERRRQAEKARQEEKRKHFEARQRREAEKKKQREEIQQILALSDPTEQVERFLKLVKGQGSSDRRNKSPAKTPSARKPNRGDRKNSQKMEDNYEEVAMEIDSDSPTLPTVEGFQFDQDDIGFMNSMPLQLQSSAFSGMELYPLPGFGPVQVLSEWPMKPMGGWVPPLPLEEPPPPPPVDIPPPAPPAPPPPLPEDPCPDTDPSRPPEEEEEDVDEELLLREQLLQSLAVKRRNTTAERGNSVCKSSSSSPVPPPNTFSPDKRVAVRERRQTPTIIRPFQLPIHKPVVIKLGDSSDESDKESLTPQPLFQSPPNMLGGIDSFLKQVRKSVDQQKQTGQSPVQVSQQLAAAEEVSEDVVMSQLSVRQMEEDLVNLRKETLKEQTILKMFIDQCNKYQNNKRLAEERVQKLQEHLATLQKIILSCSRQAEKAKAQVKEVRKRVQKKVSSYRLLEERIREQGISAFGKDYKLPVQLVKKKAVKRKTNSLDINKDTKRTSFKKVKEVVGQASPVTKRSLHEIAKEKTRLQELEQEYAKQIKALKEIQIKQGVARQNTGPEDSGCVNRTVIPSLDKISLGGTSIENSNVSEDSENLIKRRRSLLDQNISTKPNIAPCDKDSSKEEKQATAKKKGVAFTLPDGQQHQNLQQLEGEKLQKLLKSFTSIHKQRMWNGCFSCMPIPPTEELSGIDFERKFVSQKQSSSVDVSSAPCSLHYRSPLLHFKSYRLSSYYRTKEGLQLSSRTYSNRVHPHKHMCRFELQGTCNDQKCRWQHEVDYTLNQRDLLTDLASYCPKLAGVTKDTDVDDYKTYIDKYVDKVISQHGEHMSTDQLCVLVVSEVHKAAGLAHPWSVQTNKRSWRPCQTEAVKERADHVTTDNFKPADMSTSDFLGGQRPPEVDSVISEQDLRYFLDGPAVQDMESAVLEKPDNVELWISLAYKKLRGAEEESGETVPIDLCLNVLARALEENKTSSDLWYHYLKIYRHHPNSEDITELCETALACAPSYRIYLQYLSLAVCFSEKESISKRLLEYLLTSDLGDPDLRSFYLLESVVYLVDVYVQSGRYKTGLLYLQSLFPSAEKPASKLLSLMLPLDRCILWLTLISLSQFHQLPASLINPSNQNPGQLVSRRVFQLPWEDHPDLARNVAIILELLWKAVDSCCPREGPTGEACQENSSAVKEEEEIRIALYSNILTVQQLYVRDTARSTCVQWKGNNPSPPQLWTLASSIEFNAGNVTASIQLLKEGLKCQRHCAKLYQVAANLHLAQRDSNSALGLLEQCVIALYEVDIGDSKTCDPNLLYCQTLSQPVPLTYRPPPFAAGVTEAVIQDQIGSLWLNYCLLLELQGDSGQAVESYETALGLLQPRQHLTDMWQGYIQFHQRQLSATGAADKQRAVLSLTRLMHRCLSSIPVKRPLPCPGDGHWVDYTDHNQMVEVFLRCIPEESRLLVYRRLVELMPANVNLIIRSIEQALAAEDYGEAQSLCNSVLFEQAANCRLWKLAIGVNLKMKEYREVHKLYMRAVQKLPLMFTLWKDFLLFEVTEGSEMGAKWVIEQCQKLGVNIKGFVATVSKLPT